MTFTQILAWLSGPGVGSAISWLLDKWTPWVDWKPKDFAGFDPKAIIVGVGSALLGLGAYAAATNIPETTITTLDPYVAAAFPLITLLAVQLWHAKINPVLNPKTISVTTIGPTNSSTTTTVVTPPAVPPDSSVHPIGG